MIRLELPFTEEKIRALKLGDMVSISGIILTGRDAVHKYLHDGGKAPLDLSNQIIYHCGPVVMADKNAKPSGWKVMAAGPTTSSREEPYQAGIIEKYKIRAVIGKGGMGEKTKNACQKFGCVYLHAVGGAAQVLAEKIKSVEGVYLKDEFGSPEAIWVLRVEDFPAVVTIDSHGRSLHEKVAKESGEVFQKLLNQGLKKG